MISSIGFVGIMVLIGLLIIIIFYYFIFKGLE
jgi:hypothetical protein